MRTNQNISADVLKTVTDIHNKTISNIIENIFYPLTGKEVHQFMNLLGEKYIGFDKLEVDLAKKGVKDPKGAAAAIGMKKYGKNDLEKHAHEGKPLKEEDLSPTTTVPKIATAPKINPTATIKPPKSTVPKIAKPKPDTSMKVNINPKQSMDENEVVHEKFGVGKILGEVSNDHYDVMFEHGIEKVLLNDLIIFEKADRKEVRDRFAKEKNKDIPAFRRIKINKSRDKDEDSVNEETGTADRKAILAKSPTGKPIWRKIKTKQTINTGSEDTDKKLNVLGESVPHLMMQIQENYLELKFNSGETIVIEADDINKFLDKYKALNAIERAESHKFACESYDNFKEFIKEI